MVAKFYKPELWHVISAIKRQLQSENRKYTTLSDTDDYRESDSFSIFQELWIICQTLDWNSFWYCAYILVKLGSSVETDQLSFQHI